MEHRAALPFLLCRVLFWRTRAPLSAPSRLFCPRVRVSWFPSGFLSGRGTYRLIGRSSLGSFETDLTAFLYQRMNDYCIGMISSRWRAKRANVCGAGGL